MLNEMLQRFARSTRKLPDHELTREDIEKEWCVWMEGMSEESLEKREDAKL